MRVEGRHSRTSWWMSMFKAVLVSFMRWEIRIRTKSQRPSLTDISSSLATIANTKLSLRAPGDNLKSSWRSSLGRYWRSTKVLPVWKANWKKSWRGRIVKIVWREAILRRPVEKLNASEWPSTTKPSFCCGLENCCSYIGRYCASLNEWQKTLVTVRDGRISVSTRQFFAFLEFVDDPQNANKQ